MGVVPTACTLHGCVCRDAGPLLLQTSKPGNVHKGVQDSVVCCRAWVLAALVHARASP